MLENIILFICFNVIYKNKLTTLFIAARTIVADDPLVELNIIMDKILLTKILFLKGT